LGFEHSPYFSNKFKEEFGITPNQYRTEKQAVSTSNSTANSSAKTISKKLK